VTANILTLDNIVKIYPNGTQALKGVSIQVPKGAFLSVIGLSGSGKSTLMRCMNRLHEPTSGRIIFEEKDITHVSPTELRHVRSHIGMIFQQFNLVKRKNVLTNVLSGRLGKCGEIAGTLTHGLLNSWPQDWIDDAYAALRLVGIEEKALVRADSLSGGQQQRVAIARSLMQNPSLLLADEPVASLDPSTSHSVMDYLRKLNQERNVTIVANLHFLSLVREYSTHVVALRGGEKVFEGKPEEITEQWFRDIYGEQAREVEVR